MQEHIICQQTHLTKDLKTSIKNKSQIPVSLRTKAKNTQKYQNISHPASKRFTFHIWMKTEIQTSQLLIIFAFFIIIIIFLVCLVYIWEMKTATLSERILFLRMDKINRKWFRNLARIQNISSSVNSFEIYRFFRWHDSWQGSKEEG